MTYRWIRLDNGRSVYRKVVEDNRQRSELSAPMLIRDQMDALRHPITGDMVESKAQFRGITKQNGGEELGNEKPSASKQVDTTYESDVGRSIQMLKEGYKPNVIGEGSEGWH